MESDEDLLRQLTRRGYSQLLRAARTRTHGSGSLGAQQPPLGILVHDDLRDPRSRARGRPRRLAAFANLLHRAPAPRPPERPPEPGTHEELALGPAVGVFSMVRPPLRGASGQDWSLGKLCTGPAKVRLYKNGHWCRPQQTSTTQDVPQVDSESGASTYLQGAVIGCIALTGCPSPPKA